MLLVLFGGCGDNPSAEEIHVSRIGPIGPGFLVTTVRGGIGSDVVSFAPSSKRTTTIASGAFGGVHCGNGIAASSDGRIYVSATSLNRVIEIDPATFQQRLIAAGGGLLDPAPTAFPFQRPRGLAIDESANSLLVATDQGVILIDLDSHDQQLIPANSGIVIDVAVGTEGRRFALTLGGEGNDGRIELLGGGTSPIVTGFKRPRSIALGADGQLYVLTQSGLFEIPRGATAARQIYSLQNGCGLVVNEHGQLWITHGIESHGVINGHIDGRDVSSLPIPAEGRVAVVPDFRQEALNQVQELSSLLGSAKKGIATGTIPLYASPQSGSSIVATLSKGQRVFLGSVEGRWSEVLIPESRTSILRGWSEQRGIMPWSD